MECHHTQYCQPNSLDLNDDEDRDRDRDCVVTKDLKQLTILILLLIRLVHIMTPVIGKCNITRLATP
jgi:hypothetical protein